MKHTRVRRREIEIFTLNTTLEIWTFISGKRCVLEFDIYIFSCRSSTYEIRVVV